MPKTHLPAHMDSVRQKLRPKHQILILKCYPRLPKNSAADVKPNASELSYLLFYASTRRSKLQKVGTFLEKKTTKDVYNQYSARALVTLQILTALLENKVVGEGSALALIAPYVIRIISGILHTTSDISLIEASEKTWDVFCHHQDQALLTADHQYRQLYEKVVAQYAEYAHKAGAKKLGKQTTPVATHDAIRLREAGLHAIESVITSAALAFESGQRVLNISMPAILSNLRGPDAAYLENLARLTKRNEDMDKAAVQRRQSTAAARTHTETSLETDPRAAEGTVQDADALAEEGVALLAMDCLKAVFSSDNRAQLRSAAVALLNYLRELQNYRRPQTSDKSEITDLRIDTWAVKAFEQCVAWTPVQDRFILLVTAVDTMIHLPLRERDMRQHQLLASSVDNTLKSDLNLIGLSVMDIQLSLILQLLRALLEQNPPLRGLSSNKLKPTTSATSTTPISFEVLAQLIETLKACIANLSTHVYYTDQISDMITAIITRIKPNPILMGPQKSIVTAMAIEDPKTAASDVASNGSLPKGERTTGTTGTTGYFSYDIGRQVALEVVRDIIKVANSSRAINSKTTRSVNSSGVPATRQPTRINIWEGSQWLLRDPSMRVREAYVDALITWLELETTKSDLCFGMPKTTDGRMSTMDKQVIGQHAIAATKSTLARRAASNASATKNRNRNALEDNTSSSPQTFLQLLHLANYENAIQFAPNSDKDMIMINQLMGSLVKRLGMNAITSGLPMMFALQEDIARIESPIGKVRIGTLVHGYLWALVEVFDCAQDEAGQEVMEEVRRRKKHGIWVKEVEWPFEPMAKIREVSGLAIQESAAEPDLSQEVVKTEELEAFDNRAGLVDAVLRHYQKLRVGSPPASAPGSPGRGLTVPNSLERTTSSYLTAKQFDVNPESLDKARTAMMKSWSKEECLASITTISPRPASLNGSRATPPPRQARMPGEEIFNPRRRISSSSVGAGARDRSVSSAAKPALLNVEEMRTILANGGVVGSSPSAGKQAGMVGSAPGEQGEETASESLILAEEEDSGSEAGGLFSVEAVLAGVEGPEGTGGKGGVGGEVPPY
ncbi:hypothetical protein LTR62_007857 [Meristemomyces frigidus]|uniref:Protein EFR3 n=1 Tax=Meristemomyces frigidus TaxID=1508187 RepID=A0AAN7YNK7_9PEZI|nr:hypothetical protein LTR62_007857 [Meristemomyces frigidus]